MKVIVIPDVHLKPWIFDEAERIMRKDKIETAVCLGDIADDWMKTFQINAYEETYERAIQFAEKHKASQWVYGNHDLCYQLNYRETGYSVMASRTVCEEMAKLEKTLADTGRELTFVRRIGRAVFSHGGLSEDFAAEILEKESGSLSIGSTEELDGLIGQINNLPKYRLWRDDSPIWFRPQYEFGALTLPGFLQVVGHTPVRCPEIQDGILSVDLFSTTSTGTPIGTQEFAVVDTESLEVTYEKAIG